MSLESQKNHNHALYCLGFLLLRLYMTSGENLRKLLLEHGDWKSVEVTVKQWSEDSNKNQKVGGYVTKQWLMDNRSYTKCL